MTEQILPADEQPVDDERDVVSSEELFAEPGDAWQADEADVVEQRIPAPLPDLDEAEGEGDQ